MSTLLFLQKSHDLQILSASPRCRLSFIFIFAAFFASTHPVLADDVAAAKGSLGNIFAYVIVLGVALAIVIGLTTVRSSLMKSNWSLADALSEEANVTPLDNGKPMIGADGKPLIISEMKASVSRVIALMGLIGILMIYLGFGLTILANFSLTGTMIPQDQLKEIVYILLAGLTMFAPYIANKFSSVFDWLKPGK